MESKEKRFSGSVWNGFLMLFLNIALTLGSIIISIWGIPLIADGAGQELLGTWMLCAFSFSVEVPPGIDTSMSPSRWS